MLKLLSLARLKTSGVFAVPHRGIVPPQHPGKCLADHKSSSLKQMNIKPPLGTKVNQGDPEIFYDCGNVQNKFIEGKLVPFPYNYINEAQVVPIGNDDNYDSEQYEG